MRPPRTSWVVVLCVLAADQWTKWLVELHLPHGLSLEVVPGLLDLVHVRNTGAAFGILAHTGAEARWVLLVLTILALGAMALYFRALHPKDSLAYLSFGLMIGGAVGNLLDRLFAGAVTDFVDLHWANHHWPAFNLADSAITTSLGLLLVSAWKRSQREKAKTHV